MKSIYTNIIVFISFVGLTSCSMVPDVDFRDNLGSLIDTSKAARSAIRARPSADARGLITFPNYQVAVAQRGDRIIDVANRIGANSEALAQFNGISLDAELLNGEIVALPNKLDNVDQLTATVVSVTELTDAPQPIGLDEGWEPEQHKVKPGETALTIARLYNVDVRDLTEWNALGSENSVRQGQYLLIPLNINVPTVAAPGEGSITPTPPTSTRPQLRTAPSIIAPVAAKPVMAAPAIDIGQTTEVSESTAKFASPLVGNIIRGYKKGSNDGIDIEAAPGSPVFSADDGTVAAVTINTSGIAILVIKHADGILTVYTNIDNLTVKNGDKIKRGQQVATVLEGDPSFLHFEVREGLKSVDPDEYI